MTQQQLINDYIAANVLNVPKDAPFRLIESESRSYVTKDGEPAVYKWTDDGLSDFAGNIIGDDTIVQIFAGVFEIDV